MGSAVAPRMSARGCGSSETIPPVALGMRVGHCPRCTSGAGFRASTPAPSSGHLSLDPPAQALGRLPRRLLGSPQSLLPERPAPEGRRGFRAGTRGGFPGRGRDRRRPAWSARQSAVLGSAGGHWEAPQAELETFLPRGSATRARVTSRRVDLWTLLAGFRPWLFERAGGCGAAAGGRGRT